MCVLQDYTDRMFEEFLRSNSVMQLTYGGINNATRHKMMNRAKCLCLCVEEKLVI